MTILNWLYWKKQQLIKTEANNADTDLVVLGAEVPFTKRDDGYQDYAMTLKDATQSGCVANNTLVTGILDTLPYVITPGLNKTATKVIDPTSGLTLEGWKVEGSILLQGNSSYAEYLGTITIKNYNSSPYFSFNTTGTVSYDTTIPNITGFEPLGLFNSALIGGVGDYAQFAFTTTTTVVGTDLLIDIELYAGPAPMTTALGNLEAVVSFKIETLIQEGLDVTFSV
jgi:hypothetical protein